MVIPEPTIELIRQTDDLIADAVSNFQEAVRQDPGSFLRVIRRLGGHALGYADVQPEIIVRDTAEVIAEAQVQHLFDSGYDQQIGFDDPTEDSLARDPIHVARIAKLRKQQNIQSREGVMKIISRNNPNANPARDVIRWARLYFYVSRVIDWEASVNAKPEQSLPSAG